VKHDLEEFQHVVRTYGFYKRDVEAFYRSMQQSPQLSLLDLEKPEKGKPQADVDGNGHKTSDLAVGQFGADRQKAVDEVEVTTEARKTPFRHPTAADRAKAKQDARTSTH